MSNLVSYTHRPYLGSTESIVYKHSSPTTHRVSRLSKPFTNVGFTIIRSGTVSRTTKGGRRRKIALHGVNTQVRYGSAVAIFRKSTSVERISAVAKLRVKRKRSIFMSFKKRFYHYNFYWYLYYRRRFYRPRKLTGIYRGYKKSSQGRYRVPECYFFTYPLYLNIAGNTPSKLNKSTLTRFITPKVGMGVRMEPVQTSLFTNLGYRNAMIKNHGAKNPISRVKNALDLVSGFFTFEDINRTVGRSIAG